LPILFLIGALSQIGLALGGAPVNPRTIVVGSEVEIDDVEAFEESHGREPTEEDLRSLHSTWLANETLYREGLARQLDKGDDVSRELVISRMREVIDAGLKLPPVDDGQLRDWFESRRDRYDEPARYDFQEAVLSGMPSESDARAVATAMNAGIAGIGALAGVRSFNKRSRVNIEQSYGAELVKEFHSSTLGQWRAMRTRDGWRVMRLDAISAVKPAAFERMRDVVLQDWKEANLIEPRKAAIRALVESYHVIFEPPAHHH
jgi:hypothetical protein